MRTKELISVAFVLIIGFTSPLQATDASKASGGSPSKVAETNLFDFIGFFKQLYNAYEKIKNYFNPDPNLADLILQAKNEIIDEINLVRTEEQIGNVEALIEQYTIYLNNPPSRQTIEAWIRDAINVANQFEIIIQSKNPRIAYYSAKSYNLLIPIMAIMMQRENIRKEDIVPLLQDAIETNLVLLGPYTWPDSINAPFYDSSEGKLWKSYFDDHVIDLAEYESIYNIVWQANEELRKQAIAGYRDAWFYLENELDHSISPGNNNYLYAHPLPRRTFGKVEAKPFQANDANFLWRLEFQDAEKFRIVHHSGLYLSALHSGRVVLTPTDIGERTLWYLWVYFRELPAIIPEGDSTSSLGAMPDTCYVSYAGKPVYTESSQWIVQYGKSQEQVLGYHGIPCPADYDGDARADLAMMLTDGRWLIDYATDGFGAWDQVVDSPEHFHRHAQPAPGDYDGDGKTDIAVLDYSDGYWYIDYSQNQLNGWDVTRKLGSPGSVYSYFPVPADYDGDGKTDIAFCTEFGKWSLDYSSDGFGNMNSYPHSWETYFPNGDFFPIPADYDNDGKVDVSVKTFGRRWLIDQASNDFDWTNNWDADLFIAALGKSYGYPAGSPLDRNLHILRIDEGKWYSWQFLPGNPPTFLPGLNLTLSYDRQKRLLPAPADYDGDGFIDPSVVLEDGSWFIEYSGDAYDSQWDWSSNMLIITDVQRTEDNPAEPIHDFRLSTFPNPLRDHTTLQLVAARPGLVTVKIYNLLGQEVASLTREAKKQGLMNIPWDARDYTGNMVPSGVYFCRILVNGRLLRTKMLVFR